MHEIKNKNINLNVYLNIRFWQISSVSGYLKCDGVVKSVLVMTAYPLLCFCFIETYSRKWLYLLRISINNMGYTQSVWTYVTQVVFYT